MYIIYIYIAPGIFRLGCRWVRRSCPAGKLYVYMHTNIYIYNIYASCGWIMYMYTHTHTYIHILMHGYVCRAKYFPAGCKSARRSGPVGGLYMHI